MSFQGLSPIAFGTVSMVTATLGTKDPEIGTIRHEGNETYRFVYASSEISVGRGATISGVSGWTATVSSVGASVGKDWFVGVVKHATISSGSYGWLCTHGFVPIHASAAVAIAPGDIVYPGTDGFFTNVINSGVTSTGFQPVGKCVATAASASTIGMAFIRL